MKERRRRSTWRRRSRPAGVRDSSIHLLQKGSLALSILEGILGHEYFLEGIPDYKSITEEIPGYKSVLEGIPYLAP